MISRYRIDPSSSCDTNLESDRLRFPTQNTRNRLHGDVSANETKKEDWFCSKSKRKKRRHSKPRTRTTPKSCSPTCTYNGLVVISIEMCMVCCRKSVLYRCDNVVCSSNSKRYFWILESRLEARLCTSSTSEAERIF